MRSRVRSDAALFGPRSIIFYDVYLRMIGCLAQYD